MAKTHLYIEGNTGGEYVEGSGNWIEVTDRLAGAGLSVRYSIEGRLGQMVVTPPSEIEVENGDSWWLSAPQESGGDFEGFWEGRRVMVRLEKGAGTLHTLGTFRIAHENGVEISTGGKARLKLEALAQALKDADASGVSIAGAWHQSIPWNYAIKRIMAGEHGQPRIDSMPDCVLDYEYIDEGCSLVGRPGDYRGETAEFGVPLAKAVDVCWNSEDGVFCFATLNDLYEWDPSTGAYDEVTIPGTIPSDEDILRVWHKPWNGDGFYLIMTAQRQVTTQTLAAGAGYYQPMDQAYMYTENVKLWASDHFVALCTLKYDSGSRYANIAPVIYRQDLDNTTSILYYRTGFDRIFTGGVYYYYENLTIPFSQYVAVMFCRRDQAGETPGAANDIVDRTTEYKTPQTPSWDPLYSSISASENEYIQTLRAGAGDRQGMNLDDLRMGRGYYWSYTEVTSNVNINADCQDCGTRFSLGQGPMVDVSFPKYGDGSSNGRWDFWVAYFTWHKTAFYWQLVARKLYNSSGTTFTSYYVAVKSLDQWACPTFVVCDVFLNEQYSGGAIFYGWIDYQTGSTFRYVYPESATLGANPATAGLGIQWVNTAPHNSAPSFVGSASHHRFLTFTSETDPDVNTRYNRYYWTSPPSYGVAGVVYHESGRWVPVAAGIARERVRESDDEIVYRIMLLCLDRNECVPDPDTKRTGMQYKMLMIHVVAIGGSIYCYNIDDYGAGHDISWSSPLPPMGFTKMGARTSVEWNSFNNPAIYFFNPSDSGLYACRFNQSWRPTFIAHVPADDMFLNMGQLACSDLTGNTDPQIAGVTSPVFPLTGSTRWPLGEYYGFLFGPKHSGRIPLLDLTNMKKWKALGLVTQAADARSYFDRNGDFKVEKIPMAGAAGELELWPSDWKLGTRSVRGLVNTATRSINDVMPGELKVSVRLTPKSEWNLSPGFSGMGLYAVDLELVCIAGGMVSESITNQEKVGRTNWAWRQTGRRIQVNVAQDSSGTVLVLDNLYGVDEGDFVTLGIDDQDIEVGIISGAWIFLVSSLSRTYKAGDPCWIIKRSQAHWSHQTWWDDASGRFRGMAQLTEDASAGATKIYVDSVDAFSEGCFFTIKPKLDSYVDHRNIGTLRCLRIRRNREEGEIPSTTDGMIEFETTDGTALAEAVNRDDPVITWLNISPLSRSVQVGQTGVVFTIHGGGGGTAENDSEKPVHEGDRILVSYPGLIMKKNSQSKVTAQDFDSIRAHGVRKAGNLTANPFMDHNLALMDVQRRVSRGAEGLIRLTLEGVSKVGAEIEIDTAPPMTRVTVHSDELLYDRADYTSTFMLVGHEKHTEQAGANLILDELPATTRRGASVSAPWAPSDLSGLEMWFRASSLTREGYQDGNTVGFWPDDSGNGRHAYSTGVANADPDMEFLGADSDIPFVRFTKVNNQRLKVGDHEIHSNTTGLFIAIIGRKVGALDLPTNIYISKYDNAGNDRAWYFGMFLCTCQDDPAVYDANEVAQHWGTEDLHWMHMEWDPSGDGKIRGYLDKVLKHTSASACTDIGATAADIYIGADHPGTLNNANAYIAEIIICSSIPSSGDLDSLEDYFTSQPYAELLPAQGRGYDSGFSDGYG